DTTKPNAARLFWEVASALVASHGCAVTGISDGKSRKYKSYLRVKNRLPEILATTDSFGIWSRTDGVDASSFEYLLKAQISLRGADIVMDVKDRILHLRSE